MKTLITAAAFAAVTLTATTASAYTVENCPAIAETAGALTEARDGGLSRRLTKVMVQTTGFKPGIEKMLLEITDVVFNSPTITPDVMEFITLQTCVDQF